MRKTEISAWQLYMLLIIIPLSSLTSFSPVFSSSDRFSRDAWISVIITVGLTTGMSLLVYLYARRFQGLELYQSIQIVFGRHLGFVINVAIGALFAFWTAVTLKQFAYFFSGTIYLLTPVNVFGILLGLVAIMAAAEGIEYIGRLAEISGAFLMFSYVFYISFTMPLVEFQFLKPVLADGWEPIIQHGYSSFAVIGQTLWISAIAMPHVRKLDLALKAALFASLTNLVLFVISILLLIGLFDVELLSLLSFPTLSAARLVSIGNIFERLEWLAIIMWLGAMGVKVSLLLHSTTQAATAYMPRINRSILAAVFGGATIVLSLFLFPAKYGIFMFLESMLNVWLWIPLQIIAILVVTGAILRGVRGTDLPYEDQTDYAR